MALQKVNGNNNINKTMAMKKNLIYILAGISFLTSCSDEMDEPMAPANGKEVQFSVNMAGGSRTLYGEEATDGKSIKVNWVNGDKITVYGVDCATGRQECDYAVTANTTTQNYADALTKTEETGVQWGSNATSDFYAIYPAVEGAFTNSNGTISVETKIDAIQNNAFTYDETNKKWVGTPYVDNVTNLNMPNALMYAYSNDVKNGSVVDLNFKPFSTVLKFNLAGFKVTSNTSTDVGSDAIAYVQEIILRAPSSAQVAGKCTFTFTNGMPTVTGGGESVISIKPNYLPLGSEQAVEFCVFAIPQAYQMTSDGPWTVSVVTSNYGTFNYAITPTTATEVEVAKIHKIKIPLKTIEQTEIELPANNWMAWIPRNVYLSELSLPGAWYATDANYQTTTNLTEQYQNGIRAFHIDCRMSYDSSSWGFPSGNLVLTAAGTESNVVTYSPGIKVETKLAEIASAFNENPSEYIVIVLTIAEKYLNRDVGNDGNVNPSEVLTAIATMIDTYKDAWNIYTKKITSNTTINDVLGHMIIKVNLNTTADKYSAYTTVPGTLLSEASLGSDKEYITGDIIAGSFTTMQTRNMYWGKDATDLTYYYHQAQLTTNEASTTDGTGTPSYGDRKAAIDDIIEQSATIYSNNLHNGWFQLGIGGYIKPNDSEDRAAVASTLNPYVLEKVNEKLSSSPSPIGMVLMNYATTTGAELVKAIISMNTKFYLNRDQTAEEWPDGNNPYNPSAGEDNGEF